MTNDLIILLVLFSSTSNGAFISLLIQGYGEACFVWSESSKFSDATEKGLLLLLRMSRQHLLSQTKFLVGFHLLTGRWNWMRSIHVLVGLWNVSSNSYILCDLCRNDNETRTLTYYIISHNFYPSAMTTKKAKTGQSPHRLAQKQILRFLTFHCLVDARHQKHNWKMTSKRHF